MFESVGWAEIVVIVIAGLFILGPERLPSAAAWLGRTIRQVKQYAAGAREQLKREIGPEYEEYRKPLAELRELRNFNPRQAIVKHLWDDLPAEGGQHINRQMVGLAGAEIVSPTVARYRPLEIGELPPFDLEAT